VRWYRLAADQGNASAQYNLGVMDGNGEGVLQDYVEAHMWFNLAAAQSSGEDRDRRVRNRDNAAAKMTAEQVAEAQRRAREWNEAHPREPTPPLHPRPASARMSLHHVPEFRYPARRLRVHRQDW